MEWIVKNLQAVLIFTGGVVFTVIVTRYKEAIKTGTNYVIDGLLSLARIHFIMLKRYKKSVIRSYRETKVGYRNLRLDLDKNYISLKVCSFISPREKEVDEEILTEKLDVLKVMQKHRHIVMLGGPGTGKTTLMQWLLLKYAYGHMKEKLDEKLIPIFITLRSLESGQSIDDLLPEILKQHNFIGGESFIRKRMEKGKCLLIFDGMDEIVDDETRKKFVGDICGTYANLYGKSRIVITSRIEEYPVDCFSASFREREILDLDMEQVQDFVHGILKSEDKPGELIRQIEKSEGLKKFVTNPLMLSLLTFVYQESHQKLPYDRVRVYNKCMQLMMEDRDKSRGIYEYRNQFDTDDKELLLCKLAYDFSLENKWRFTEKELLEHWLNNLPPNLKKSDLKELLKEVCNANGILKHLSGKILIFLHRPFQEYCAAKEFFKRNLSALENSKDSLPFTQLIKKEWYEITLFLVGMMENSSHLINQLSIHDPQLSLQGLIYAKRIEKNVIKIVINRVMNKLKRENVFGISDSFIYLAYRFGLEIVTSSISQIFREVSDENHKELLWQLIDHVMSSLSPRKQMVYVSSTIVQLTIKERKWVPGYWIDKYPVTNADYQTWVEIDRVEELPRHWEVKSKEEEPLITEHMKLLPIVDVTYEKAKAYSSYLNKRIPDREKWRKIGGSTTEDSMNRIKEHRMGYLKKSKLKQAYFCYCRAHSLTLAISRDFVPDHTHDFNPSRDFTDLRDLSRKLIRDFVNAREFDLTSVHHLVHVFDRAYDLACILAHLRDLASAFITARYKYRTHGNIPILEADRDQSISYACDLAFTLANDIGKNFPPECGKMKKHLEDAQKITQIIAEKLEDSWINRTWEQEHTSALRKALTNSLVAFMEELQGNILANLIGVLRQPGMLTPVTKYISNSLGIYYSADNFWEWTSTANKYGDLLVCSAGVWNEEKFEPNKNEWVPCGWKDINLGFRCVCDWDKITEVLTPEELRKNERRGTRDERRLRTNDGA